MFQVIRYDLTNAVVDPGFPRYGFQPLSSGQNPYIWQDFDRKMHTIKEIGPERWGARVRSLAIPWIRQCNRYRIFKKIILWILYTSKPLTEKGFPVFVTP